MQYIDVGHFSISSNESESDEEDKCDDEVK